MAERGPQRRDAARTREKIIDAAQRLFTRTGYDALGVRDIAGKAEVDPALVARYFGSKEGLFREAVVEKVSLAELLDGEKSTFGTRIAEIMVRKDLSGQPLDIAAAFANSIGSPAVGGMLSELMDTVLVPQMAEWLGGKDAEQRAALLLGELLGFEILHRVAGLKTLGAAHSEVIARKLANSLQAHVDGDAG